MVTSLPSLKPSKSDEQDLQDTTREVRRNSWVMFSSGPLHMDEQVLNDQLELIHSSSVQTQDVSKKTY